MSEGLSRVVFRWGITLGGRSTCSNHGSVEFNGSSTLNPKMNNKLILCNLVVL